MDNASFKFCSAELSHRKGPFSNLSRVQLGNDRQDISLKISEHKHLLVTAVSFLQKAYLVKLENDASKH